MIILGWILIILCHLFAYFITTEYVKIKKGATKGKTVAIYLAMLILWPWWVLNVIKRKK